MKTLDSKSKALKRGVEPRNAYTKKQRKDQESAEASQAEESQAPYNISPEIVKAEAYTMSTDIWSMGVVLYEMCALKPPFEATSLAGLCLKITRG